MANRAMPTYFCTLTAPVYKMGSNNNAFLPFLHLKHIKHIVPTPKTYKMLFLIPISLVISVVSGHATLSPPVASSRYYTADVRITHGLNKTATDMIVVTIPESISSVRVGCPYMSAMFLKLILLRLL